MKNLQTIADQVVEVFEELTHARDQALINARQLTRKSAHTIRAIHRLEREEAQSLLAEACELQHKLNTDLANYPTLLYAGYTMDAIKEFVEASITYALIVDDPLPTPQDLGVEPATYLNGLAEVTGELRRRVLDILRHGYSEEAERLLTIMDEIYSVLVTIDYPDAITNGLRRQTDLVRGIVERTRGDMTIALQEERLKQSMEALQNRLDEANR
ncbi:haloacid dehalogenase [Ornatilinea apprima]|uniref:Haloacid dehalogenase n=1 Tax=Ornatilinea apprima TaxID=1134406 RepID=A0A0P6XW41_9CHLR|nr:haloacid dehalogenase [Ornatilinea apprima]KPL77652.1 haloacid dehalogenase [Ornatilinea apprima]